MQSKGIVMEEIYQKYAQTVYKYLLSKTQNADLKEVGKNMNLLESLVQKIGFSNVVISTTEADSSAPAGDTESEKLTENVLQFTISNFAEDDVSGMKLDVECEGGQTHQSVIAGDDVVFQTGENIDFQLIAEDFPKNIPDGSRITLKLSLIDKDGNTHEVQNEAALDVAHQPNDEVNVLGYDKDFVVVADIPSFADV